MNWNIIKLKNLKNRYHLNWKNRAFLGLVWTTKTGEKIHSHLSKSHHYFELELEAITWENTGTLQFKGNRPQRFTWFLKIKFNFAQLKLIKTNNKLKLIHQRYPRIYFRNQEKYEIRTSDFQIYLKRKFATIPAWNGYLRKYHTATFQDLIRS